MDIDLKYFSGTGNSRKILDTCKDIFLEKECSATLASITEAPAINEAADLLGFCFPVYAFDLPRIAKKYLSELPSFKTPNKAFLLITAGASAESGFAVKEGVRLLKSKGLDVVYSCVIEMPNNWTIGMNPPSKEEAQNIIDVGVRMVKEIAQDILGGAIRHHTFNYPPRYSRLGFYKDYYLFKWLGVTYMWRDYRVDETCNACGICEKVCPTRSIRMNEGKPIWSSSCEQCMRCVNFCPKQAIYQKAEGSIKGKNTYHEPTFNPLRCNV